MSRAIGSWLRKLAVYLGIVLASSAMAIAIAEVYLSRQAARLSRAAIRFDNRLYPYVMFRPYESIEWVSGETYEMSHHRSRVFFYSNEDGFRIPSKDYRLPKEKPAGQLRIAVLGGSAVQLGSTFDATLPGSLRKYLRNEYPGRDIEVINAGVQAYVARQSVVQLLLAVVEYRPDIVILYDGVNDIGLPMTFEARSNFPYNFQVMEASWEAYGKARKESLGAILLGRSEVYRVVSSTLFPNRQGSESWALRPDSPYGLKIMPAAQVAKDREFVRQHVSQYLSNWVKLIELSRAYRFEPVLVLQPTGGLEPEYALAMNMKAYHLDRRAALDWNDAFTAMYDEAWRQIQELRGRFPGVVFLDLSRFLRPARDHFWDVVHVYDETNLLIAEKLASEVEPVLKGSWAKEGAHHDVRSARRGGRH